MSHYTTIKKQQVDCIGTGEIYHLLNKIRTKCKLFGTYLHMGKDNSLGLARLWAFYPLLKVSWMSNITYSLKIGKKVYCQGQGLGIPLSRRVFQPRGVGVKRGGFCKLVLGTRVPSVPLGSKHCAGALSPGLCCKPSGGIFQNWLVSQKQLRKGGLRVENRSWPSCARRSVKINHVLFLIRASLMRSWEQCIMFL